MFSQRVASFCLTHRLKIILFTLIGTIIMSFFASRLEVKTIFNDLLPTNHSYIQVNDEFKTTFGSANIVTLMIETEQGDIFQPAVLSAVKGLSDDLRYIDAVNQFQIISLASKKMKAYTASSEGIESRPIMWPGLPQTAADYQRLRQDVMQSPLVLGTYISRDLQSTLITVDFIEHKINYENVYPQINEIIARYQAPGIKIRVIGQPILSGILFELLPETLTITAYIVAAVAIILLLASGTLRGVLLPLLAAATSGIWALGVSQLIGINLDPLGIVIAFLIAARAISHAVQINLAFDTEKLAGIKSSKEAARITLARLFRPGTLGLITDAGGILVVTLAPIPLLQKAALMGAIWVGSMLLCNMIMNPILLSWLKGKTPEDHFSFGLKKLMAVFLSWCGRITTHKVSAVAVLIVSIVLLLSSVNAALDLTIGDAKAGSPLLWSEHKYNQHDSAISQRFPGNEHMFVVVKGFDRDAMKHPEVLRNISRLQQEIESLPEVGSTSSLADVIRPINMLLNEGNPRFYKIGDDNAVNAELLYLALAGSDPGDIDRFSDFQYKNGAIQLTVKDHRGDTIRTVIQAIKNYKQQNPMDKAEYVLAGGYIGVIAAVNEEIFSGQAQSIALALLVLFVCCALAYRSPQAGLFFLPLVLLSNTITFAFMSVNGIGLNVSTLPVAALGIGLGVDFAFYIVDSIRERLNEKYSLVDSIRFTLVSTGRGIFITALTMFASVIFWYFFSSLRFQAEMGLLIALWMTVSALSALLVIPSMIYLFKPNFVVSPVADNSIDDPSNENESTQSSSVLSTCN